MREYTMDQGAAGKRLDKWLLSELPALPASLAQKYIRLKRVKVNGKGAARDARLAQGDVVSLYIADEFFEKPKAIDPLLSAFRPRLLTVYEDQHILLVDKRPGLLVHPDEREKLNTLVTHAQAYLYQKGEYDSQSEGSFAPVPCNRIDRFTGGIVIIAKTREAMRVLLQKIRDREIGKYYLCVARGALRPPEGRLEGYLLKGDAQKKVTVLHRPAPGAQYAQTGYRTLAQRNGLSLVECELLTGRTHQIRAQFADAGHPLLGDAQYGDRALNERSGRAFQALYAYRISFDFATDAGPLEYLKGKSFSVSNVPFARDFD